MRRALVGLSGVALLILASPSTFAQQRGIGIFTEGENYATISVPGKPGEIPSAPTIQDAVDMAKGRTFISVNLPTSPGFAVDGKEIAVGFNATTVTSSITFTGCSRAILIGPFTSTSLIAFVKNTQNILVQFGDLDRVLIEDSSYGHVDNNTIHGGLFIRRSAGIYVSEDEFTRAAPSLVVRDCNDLPGGSPPPAEWAKYLNDYPVAVGGCHFTKIGPSITITAAALLIKSRVSLQSCKFEEIEERGVEADDCAYVSLQYNTFYKARDSAIAFYDSEGLIQSNKIRDVKDISSEIATGSNGIFVQTIGPGFGPQPRRSRVKVDGNEIAEVEAGIYCIDATVNITGNTITGGQVGVLVTDGCDGAIVGGLFKETRLYAIAVFSVAPGFLIQYTTMDSVKGYGMAIAFSKQIIVKDVEWRTQCENCDRADALRQPVLTGGIQIVASEVSLENVRIGSRLSGFALNVQADSKRGPSTVQCSLSRFDAYGPGAGILIDASSLTASATASWSDGRCLIAQYAAEVTISNGDFISNLQVSNGGDLRANNSTPITLESKAKLDLNQGRVSQTFTVVVSADQRSNAPDVIIVSSQANIKLSGVGISGLGALVHVADLGTGVFENCDLSGSTQIGGNNALTGPFDGFLVEDYGQVEIRGGRIYHQGERGIRTSSHGRVIANGLTINLSKTYVQVDADGRAEIDGCTFGDENAGLIGILVNSGGVATIRSTTIGHFFDCGIKVASGGKCDLTNCTIHNGDTGIRAETGATLTQSGTQFRELTNMPEPSTSGGKQ